MKYDGLEIAIIGISAQFPQSHNYRQFWQNLRAGKELITTFTDDELRKAGVPEDELQNERYVKTAAVLNGKDFFDAGFFGYTTEEATLMDPQIRLLHEHCWKALEDAGCASAIETTRIGLFAGASVNDNWKIYAFASSRDSQSDPFYLNMIISQTFANTLVSYKLNLRGPSLFVDSACSTSLTAIHLACRSLLTRECAVALAGGVTVNTRKQKGYIYREGMVASSDGHCRTFDAQSSGTVSGEGIGILVLKRLRDAMEDGDHIYSIIRATAVNNDGNYKVGYTAPGVKGQAECIRMAQKLAGVDPHSVSYIEAHGTGTRLGDPVEIRALNEAFGTGGQEKFCAIGSVKTNIGHTDTAAGVAGMIKTILSLKHKEIPPSLHFKEPNPEIDFGGGPFFVNAELSPWERKGDAPLRAGVSSFGIGGTNTHAILEEAPGWQTQESSPPQVQATPPPLAPGRPFKWLALSARTPGSLLRYADALKDFLQTEPETQLADMAYMLHVGRKHFGYRKSIIYKDRNDLIRALGEKKLQEQVIPAEDSKKTIVFMFPGQGSQYADMSRGLFEQEPLFREWMDRGFSFIRQETGEDFRQVLFPASASGDGLSGDAVMGRDKIHATQYSQPLIFLVEYSLARLLMSIGITPQYMIGHSIGEYVAACLSGVFDFEDALRLVIRRGALMGSLPGGEMISVAVSAEKARGWLDGNISLAAINSPEQVVLSGSGPSMVRLLEQLDQAGVAYVRLHTSHAFHSNMQDGILEAFRTEVKKVRLSSLLTYPFVSNRTGGWIAGEEAASAEYWVRQLRETVQFSTGISTLMSTGRELVAIEVGAGHSLTGLAKQHAKGKKLVSVNLLRSVRDVEDDGRYLTARIGQLWEQGVPIDWNKYYEGEKRRKVSLPTYCFEQIPYPAEVDPFGSGLLSGKASSGTGDLKNWIYYPGWRRQVLQVRQATESRRGYVFFSTGRDFSGPVTKRLLREQDIAVEVLSGDRYERLSKYCYVIYPGHESHFSRLMNDLHQDGVPVTDIIYAWGMQVKERPDPFFDQMQKVFFSLIKVVRALARTKGTSDYRIAIITDSLHKVVDTEKIAYGQSPLLGLANVLTQEYSVSCCNIDVDGKTGEDMLAEEIKNRYGNDRVVALRGGQRWIRDYQKNEQDLRREKSTVRSGGIYLITGGLGNLGYTLAKYLISNYGATLILTGRKELGESGGRMPEGGAEKESALVRWSYLRGISESVRYVAADVSDALSFRTAVETAEAAVGPIQGVIHAAGIVDARHFELVQDLTEDKALEMFAPKIQGIENIYEIFGERELDFVWAASSLATVLGGLGSGAYSAANLYMDHFMYAKQEQLPRWKCIDLPGMIFNEVDTAANEGRAVLLPAEIIALFEWSIGERKSPVLLGSIGDLPARMEHAFGAKKDILVKGGPDGRHPPKIERPGLSVAYTEPVTETEKKLVEIFGDFFGMEGIGVEDDFFELGGDSLKGMALLMRIRNEFDINIALRDLLSNLTIRGIAAKVDEMIWFKSDVGMTNEIVI